MTVSYNWLSEYLPVKVEPEALSAILTAVGLEVEHMTVYDTAKGKLTGLLVGEILQCIPHPNADKLKVTTVAIGSDTLQIVCGASNVAVGQKVVVAPVGVTIYPVKGEPVTMRTAIIRGVESEGMLCAEDEIGTGTSHEGIMVLPADAAAGTSVSDYINHYSDTIYEIGLTPNRMDAMSHYGVAKDVCAYLTHHTAKPCIPISPFTRQFQPDTTIFPIEVEIENDEACKRYSGVSISGITVKESPQWLINKLNAIGQRPINNIVDITNYILNETGQPLHAFDFNAITGNKILVKNVQNDTLFTALDGRQRKLSSEDLMICNISEPMCIAGVFGGLHSGVKDDTKHIFLESAWFNPVSIRKTSFRHGLRTEAAARFEKGVDISNVVTVLMRAALLIKEVAGGEISSDIIDVYPQPQPKTEIVLKYAYLKKLSGKSYYPTDVTSILTALGFEVVEEGGEELRVSVPFSKPDIMLPADVVEEILRIDGLDNIALTGKVTITPANDEFALAEKLRNNIAAFLAARGFNEILTNSITSSSYFTENQLTTTVKMINNLSAELDVLRPSMVETGLETIAYNLNRKNMNCLFFEFGKTYHQQAIGQYIEKEHLALYISGKANEDGWKLKANSVDGYYAKGITTAILKLCGVTDASMIEDEPSNTLKYLVESDTLATIAPITQKQLQPFSIKHGVYFIDFNWALLVRSMADQAITYREVAKYPAVQRDIAIVVDSSLPYKAVEQAISKTALPKLKQVQLFDVFESEKLGNNKKSFAINFSFQDEEKTLTDAQTDEMVNTLVEAFKRELGAEIRK